MGISTGPRNVVEIEEVTQKRRSLEPSGMKIFRSFQRTPYKKPRWRGESNSKKEGSKAAVTAPISSHRERHKQIKHREYVRGKC